jgi:hypothetical protein
MSITTTPITMESLHSLLLEQSKQIERLSEMLRTLGIQPSLAAAAAAASIAPTKGRKKTIAAAEGAEKPKRPLNAWFQFTARVRALIQAFEETSGAPKQARMPAMTIQMFASHLKEQKAYDAWTDEEITEALTGWEAPALSKQAAKRAETLSDSGSVASAAPSEPATEAVAKTPKKEKALRAAAKKTAEPVAAPVAAAAEPVAAEKPKKEKKQSKKAAAAPADSASKAEAPAEKPKKAKKQSKKAAAAAADSDAEAAEEPPAAPVAVATLDLKFRSWTHNGTEYYKNERGDVISTEMEWVGLWNGKTLNETAPEPEDLAEAEFADE